MSNLNSNIFDIKEVNAPSDLKGMEILYDLEHGNLGDRNYLRERVLRDKAGRYYMSVKCGEAVSYFHSLSYDFSGREVYFPAVREALALWAKKNLQNGDYARAWKEFGRNVRLREKVWEYQQGNDKTQPGFLCEYLRKTDTDTYALFSTDSTYPYWGCSAAVVKGSRTVRNDLYLYYITADTAQRWAEARGIDAYTYKEAFG